MKFTWEERGMLFLGFLIFIAPLLYFAPNEPRLFGIVMFFYGMLVGAELRERRMNRDKHR